MDSKTAKKTVAAKARTKRGKELRDKISDADAAKVEALAADVLAGKLSAEAAILSVLTDAGFGG